MKNYQKFIVGLIFTGIVIFITTLSVNAFFESAVNNDSKLTKNISVFDKEILATYAYSQNDINVYRDNENAEYLVKENNVIGFVKNIPVASVKSRNISITEEDAIDIASRFINNEILNFEDYDLVYTNYVTYSENYSEYQFSYTKKLANYNTTDLIYITVDTTGNISSFLTKDTGEFDMFTNIMISQDVIREFIQHQIDSKYSEKTIKSINELDKTFKKEDDHLVLECAVEVTLGDGSKILEMLLYSI